MGGTFSGSFTIDYIPPKGRACYLCMTDTCKKEHIERLHPGNILNIKDLSWIPRNDNPVG